MIGGLILWKKLISIELLLATMSYSIHALKWNVSMDTKYNVIEVVENNITDTELKEIINNKLYRIIELMELSVSFDE